MKFGLTPSQYQFILDELKPILSKNVCIYCYGSRSRGDHAAFSDLDLMVETGEDLSKEISLVLERIQKSNFPYMVDLVSYSDFAESYKKQYQIDKKRLCP